MLSTKFPVSLDDLTLSELFLLRKYLKEQYSSKMEIDGKIEGSILAIETEIEKRIKNVAG